MLPIVWFYIVLVIVSWLVLFFLELRRRARRKVAGCPELVMISAEKLESLAIREPELLLIELIGEDDEGQACASGTQLTARFWQEQILGVSCKVSELKKLLSANAGRVIAFYSSPQTAIDWERVGDVLFALKLKKALVLEGSVGPAPRHAHSHVTPSVPHSALL